jgi:hypothetical protein
MMLRDSREEGREGRRWDLEVEDFLERGGEWWVDEEEDEAVMGAPTFSPRLGLPPALCFERRRRRVLVPM